MTLHLGTVPAGSTLYIPFATYGGTNGESITCSGLATTDIEIYRNGSVTQRASDSGFALLDTDGIDFDGVTGIHGFSVDLSDNTDAGFFAVGSFYWVVVSAITVDSQTVNFIAATFRIGPAESQTGYPKVDAQYVEGSDATDQINAACDTALADYDAPTKAELDAGLAALNDLDAAGIRTAIGLAAANLDTQLAAIVEDTGTTLPATLSTLATAAAVAALNDLSSADVTAAVPTTAEIKTAIEAAGSHLALILEDTGTTLPATLATLATAAAIAALNDLSAAEVNAEIVDALATDTYAEPGQGAPAATATLAAKINYLYKAWRNKKEQTVTAFKLYDDAGTTVDQKSTDSDDGTTATKGEIGSGP